MVGRQPIVSSTCALASGLFPILMSSSVLTSKMSYQEDNLYIKVFKRLAQALVCLPQARLSDQLPY